MNAPHPLRDPAPAALSLDDKYTLQHGRAFMSGIQALVRLPMLQRQRDLMAGHNTAGFVSGYRGSPLGGYDQALVKAQKYLDENHIVFQPGVNEDLAATAVWGTQQLGYLNPGQHKYDGVFGLWYGKGPGVDRSADVFKHANMAGTTPLGGVVAVAGDDHVAKSSTAVHQSDHIFKACGLPVFFPANVQEILDLGLHAFAMSRFSGVWTSLKTIQEVVESSAAVEVDADRVNIILPDDFEMPPGGLHIRWPDSPLDQEARLFNYKWYAALAYVRANRLNHNVIEGPNDRLGLIASGKAYNDTRQALMDLGLDDAACRRLGIRLHKVAVVWPLEAQITREFATGLKEILVIEEKRQVIEYQLKEELYNWHPDIRPTVVGKFAEGQGDGDSGGEWSMSNPSANTLLRATADLNPALIAQAIAARLKKLGVDGDEAARIDAQIAILKAKEEAQLSRSDPAAERAPWFCPGCPHNTSTKVPEGSRAAGGIGCHYMATWMDRSTMGFTQMGGEGVTWVGQQPFTREAHIFSNLGDGTYFHSGLLAIRQSIAAGVNITYKILYNDAVAMTGGQQVGERPEGHSVLQIVNSLLSEGVTELVIVTDQPDKYRATALPGGIKVLARTQFDAVQERLRRVKGTTALIYDQTCATEKRRRRKRGTTAASTVRTMINPLVCEGCGDCGTQSNCLSIEPLATPLGTKRTINQNSCNQDLRCVDGLCPSFITVEGGRLKKAQTQSMPTPQTLQERFGALPAPPDASVQALQRGRVWGVLVAGVGGTGVITIGQLLGVAAHIEGKGIVTQDAAGLAQKGGATWSHILLAQDQDSILSTRVGTAAADLVLGCDPIVTAHPETLARVLPGRTRIVQNTHTAPTAELIHNRDWQAPGDPCIEQIRAVAGQQAVCTFDAHGMAQKLMGDSIYTNPIVMGYAWQMGWLPVGLDALDQAIALNGVAIEANRTAFAWGRWAALQPRAVAELLKPAPAPQAVVLQGPLASRLTEGALDEAIALRRQFLVDYQDEAYARRYSDTVEQVAAAETQVPGAARRLERSVALALFRLMAIKDEYEVARLHRDPAFQAQIAQQFEGDFQVFHHLAPPGLSRKDAKGRPIKRRIGQATAQKVFDRLIAFKSVRGTWKDPFGWTTERRRERALREQLFALIAHWLRRLQASPDEATLTAAADSIALAQQVRGYGEVKDKAMSAVELQWRQTLAGT
ncbi:indolepyruvate ferredoxin oxidoreductase family protein [Amphibiibacter pelophylacis]|uniref:Indolepyruvate ferredoxin oxidoreductase family protein n=1 Tax=Amphibiibacter pelophylacis TaxID=1799477 RepID=A0ACC6P414_9BURK